MHRRGCLCGSPEVGYRPYLSKCPQTGTFLSWCSTRINCCRQWYSIVGGGAGWGDKLNYSYVSKMFHTVEAILSFRNAICAITGNKWNDAIRTHNTQGSWLARVMKMEESRLTYNIKLKYKLLYSNSLLNEDSCDTHSEPKVVVIYKTISPTTIRIKYTYDRQWSLPVIVKQYYKL